MDIKYRNFMGRETESSLASYVSGHLASSLSSGGAIEDVTDLARNTADAMGNLIDLLVDKHVLTLRDVLTAIGSCDNVDEL